MIKLKTSKHITHIHSTTSHSYTACFRDRILYSHIYMSVYVSIIYLESFNVKGKVRGKTGHVVKLHFCIIGAKRAPFLL